MTSDQAFPGERPRFPAAELGAWFRSPGVQRPLGAFMIGVVAAAVVAAVVPGLSLIAVLVLAARRGRYAVLGFFLVSMVAAGLRPHEDHGRTSLEHGAARVVAFAPKPGVADWPTLAIFDSLHDEDYGVFIDYLRPRGKDHDDVAISFWGSGTERDPFGISFQPERGTELYGTDGKGCTFDLLGADPAVAFAGTVRCDTMETNGQAPMTDVGLEVRFTASP